MDNHNINNIIFNKRRNNEQCGKPRKLMREYNFNGLKLTLNNAWYFIPGIWRMSSVRQNWMPVKQKPEGRFINQWGTNSQRAQVEYCEAMGIYFYGGLKEYPYIIHNGNTWRMAEWRRDGNKPGGRLEWDVMHTAWFPPWMHPKPRPTNKALKFVDKKTVNTENFQKLLDELPDEWRKEIER